jgi:hypothetical protein
MSKKPVIGRITSVGRQAPIYIDVPTLVESRLLLQANSGAGKSWAVRRLLEQTHGKVQQIILDPEDEFHTLREKFDYVLAGRDGGDCPAEPRSADLLARRILELGVSTIIGIFELKAHERQLFVRRFLETLVNAPRRLWHPALVVIDEAHMFCPEKGRAESAGAVIDLMTRGRKRGFCGVLATQRISKLHKDAAAETNNKLIGRASLDIDMKRASDELGFHTKEHQRMLRGLKPGHFFAFGPAFCEEVELIKVGKVTTTHPKAGQRSTPPAPPRAKIKKVLKELADLPEEAQQEIRDLAAAKKEISTLRRELTQAKRAQPKVKEVQKKLTEAEKARMIVQAKAEVLKLVRERQKPAEEAFNVIVKAQEGLIEALREVRSLAVDGALTLRKNQVRGKVEFPTVQTMEAVASVVAPAPERSPASRPNVSRAPRDNGDFKLGNGGDRRMLEALVKCHPMKLTKAQWGSLSKMTHTGGSFQTYMSRLRQAGLFTEEGDLFLANENTFELLGAVPNTPRSNEEMIEMWKRILGGTPAKMIDYILEAHSEVGQAPTKAEVATAMGMTCGGGTFQTYVSRLRTNGLIKIQGAHIYLGEMMKWEPE